ncbi:GntR family transcriptional regulator [Mesobacillus foraminis]|uniref:GntR family transcriptional regulator n=1 Tax=Mesobacillus foraminis TaxID=279826 RepID=A0A4R2B6Y2_9BACI|nr:GntR family transcriptional regulator [Mesobacillus foraminis]TCN21149.1 GntR family transcriptional regulator [Mesobacillus foraminis]
MDQNSRLPLYIQLKMWIIKQIENEVFKSGGKIPTEHNLSEMHNISRPTVRQALSELVQEGYLTKRRGLGTFVSSPLFTGDATIFRTFAEEMEIFGFSHSAKLIDKKIYPASSSLAKSLCIEEGDEVFELVRLRYAIGKPLAIRTSIIPVKLYPNLLEENLEELYSLFAQKGIFPKRSKQTFQAVPANEKEAELLNVTEGTPLMLWEGIVFTTNELPMEKVKVVYLGSHFRFEIDQTRQQPNIYLNNDNEWVSDNK